MRFPGARIYLATQKTIFYPGVRFFLGGLKHRQAPSFCRSIWHGLTRMHFSERNGGANAALPDEAMAPTMERRVCRNSFSSQITVWCSQAGLKMHSEFAPDAFRTTPLTLGKYSCYTVGYRVVIHHCSGRGRGWGLFHKRILDQPRPAGNARVERRFGLPSTQTEVAVWSKQALF